MFEPYKSFRLLDAAAVGTTVIISFAWGKPEDDDGHIFLLPMDTRGLDIDPSDETTVVTVTSHFIEFSLGWDREEWEPKRAFRVSDKLSVVRPWMPRTS